MGNQSSSASFCQSTPIRVAIVGLTDTGKSRFISMVTEGAPNSETLSPTCGTYEGDVSFAHQRIRLVEMGSSVGDTWRHLFGLSQFDCILWFIDSHDSLEEILSARNRLLAATLDTHCPMCIVHNTGRQAMTRRDIIMSTEMSRGITRTVYSWKPREKRQQQLREAHPLAWDHIPDMIGMRYLAQLYRCIHITQLSYRNPESITAILNWVIIVTTTPNPLLKQA